MVNCFATNLLGRHVADCSHHDARISIDASRWDLSLRTAAVGSRKFREAKVQNLYPAIFGNEDVVRLEIPMNDSFLMRRCQSLRNLTRIFNHSPLGQWAS